MYNADSDMCIDNLWEALNSMVELCWALSEVGFFWQFPPWTSWRSSTRIIKKNCHGKVQQTSLTTSSFWILPKSNSINSMGSWVNDIMTHGMVVYATLMRDVEVNELPHGHGEHWNSKFKIAKISRSFPLKFKIPIISSKTLMIFDTWNGD